MGSTGSCSFYWWRMAMTFPYLPFRVSPTPAQPGSTIYRPIVPLVVSGSGSDVVTLALVDTGADETLIPDFLLPQIGIKVSDEETARFEGVGEGYMTVRYATVRLGIVHGGEEYGWEAKVGFFEGDNFALLGHTGFLQYFTVACDGAGRMVSLSPNESLPQQ